MVGHPPTIPMAEKWIAGAIKRPGALHKELGVPAGQKIPAKKLAKAADKGGKEGQRARLAETLKGMRHPKGKTTPIDTDRGKFAFRNQRGEG